MCAIEPVTVEEAAWISDKLLAGGLSISKSIR